MQYTSAVLFASVAAAQTVSINYPLPNFQAGQTAAIRVAADGEYTLQLRYGNANDLTTSGNITCGAVDSTYNWQVPSTLPAGNDYALEIIGSDGTTNFAGPFSITGGPTSGDRMIASGPGCNAGAPTGSSSSVMSGSSSTMMGGVYGGASTMSTAVQASNNGCAATQIADGQVQAPTGCPSNTPVVTPISSQPAYNPAPKITPVPGYNSAALPGPYAPMGGATGSPAAGNSTMPTYSMPSTPTGNSGSGSGASAPKGTKAPASGASTFGSSIALIAGAVAAFAFLN